MECQTLEILSELEHKPDVDELLGWRVLKIPQLKFGLENFTRERFDYLYRKDIFVCPDQPLEGEQFFALPCSLLAKYSILVDCIFHVCSSCVACLTSK